MALDVLIALPLIPLLILGIIWLMPWEDWVSKNVPKAALGPYLLYCAFALWHFHADYELVIVFVIIGLSVCGLALKQIYDNWKAGPRPDL